MRSSPRQGKRYKPLQGHLPSGPARAAVSFGTWTFGVLPVRRHPRRLKRRRARHLVKPVFCQAEICSRRQAARSDRHITIKIVFRVHSLPCELLLLSLADITNHSGCQNTCSESAAQTKSESCCRGHANAMASRHPGMQRDCTANPAVAAPAAAEPAARRGRTGHESNSFLEPRGVRGCVAGRADHVEPALRPGVSFVGRQVLGPFPSHGVLPRAARATRRLRRC